MKKNHIWDEILHSSTCFSQEMKSDVYFKVQWLVFIKCQYPKGSDVKRGKTEA